MDSKAKNSENKIEIATKEMRVQIEQQYQGMTRIAHCIIYSDLTSATLIIH